MTIYVPVRLDRMQRGLFEAIEAGTGHECHWGKTEPTHEQLPADYFDLTVIGGPGPVNRDARRGTLLNPSTSIVVKVDTALVGARAGFDLNEFFYYTDIVGGDTVTTVRDRLRDLVNADAIEPVTVSDVGVDEMLLTADFVGALRSLVIHGPLSTNSNIVNDQSVNVTEGSQDMLINIQAFSKGKQPRNGAAAMIALAFATLQTEQHVEQLLAEGVGLWNKGAPTDLSAVAGGRWETRNSFDLQVALQAAWVTPVGRIESLTTVTTISGITTTQTIAAP